MAFGNVDSMMYSGKRPWHSFGEAAKEAPTAEEAIKLAGLDWLVETVPVYYGENKIEAQNMYATMRSDTQGLLGIVSDRYKIFQNRDAFAMVDALLDMGAKIETAGALDEGRKTWILAKLEPWQLLGDAIDSYLFVANHHDGKGSLVAGSTNVRIVCENTFDAAINGAKRKWSIKHMGLDLNSRLLQATEALQLNNAYREALTATAEVLAVKKLTPSMKQNFLEKLIPLDDDAKGIIKTRIEETREQILKLANKNDLANFRNTAWGMYQAVADYAYHATPFRQTETYASNQMKYAIDGHPLVQKAYELLNA